VAVREEGLELGDGKRITGDPERSIDFAGGLSAMLQACVGRDWSWCQAVSRRWEGTPAARCAVETALLELRSQCAGIPLALYLNPDADGVVAVNAALDQCPAAILNVPQNLE
jgi:L-alanine-DL-glutamate epimerase-like enolase superfamily enzyme